jgi:hypothetical protein
MTKECERGIVHFHRPSSEYSDLLKQHIRRLAEIHIETKFMLLDAEKSPFLSDRLKIRFLHPLSLVFIPLFLHILHLELFLHYFLWKRELLPEKSKDLIPTAG